MQSSSVWRMRGCIGPRRPLFNRAFAIAFLLSAFLFAVQVLGFGQTDQTPTSIPVRTALKAKPAHAVAVSRSAAAQASGLNFVTVVYGSGGYGTDSVAVADVNGDGKLDLVVANCGGRCLDGSSQHSTVGVLLGNGDGTFQTAVTYDSGAFWASSVAVSDMNADGKPDVIVAHVCGTSDLCTEDGTVDVLLGNGDGTFQPAVAYDSGGLSPYSVAVADVNGDGKPDLLVQNFCADITNCYIGGSISTVGVLLGNGDGTFQTAVAYSSGGNQAQSMAVADVNGDGKPDLLVANFCPSSSSCVNGTVGVLLGNGDGTFQVAVTYASGGNQASAVTASDVNSDGKVDLLVSNLCVSTTNCANGTVGVLLGNGDGTFQAAVTYASGGYSPHSVAVADMNADGNADLVVLNDGADANDGEGMTGVLLGNGDGTFETAALYDSGGHASRAIAVADLNRDGKVDVVVANGCATGYGRVCVSDVGSVGVLISTNLTATATTLMSSLSAPNAGQGVTFTATVTAQGGTPTGTVTFFDGTSNVGNSPVNSSGVATLMTSTLTAGIHIITATYSGDTTHTSSSSSAVTLNVADFQIAANPSTVTVSAPGQGGTTTLTITPLGGFNQTLSYACSSLPAGASCSFASTSDGATMIISTTAPSAQLRAMPFGGNTLLYAMLLPCLLGFASAGVRRRTLRGMRPAGLLCALTFCLVWVACSASSGSSSSKSGTPTGTSTVTVTATAGSLSHQTSITLTVQ